MDLLDDELSQWLAEWAAMDGGRFVNFETHHRQVYQAISAAIGVDLDWETREE